MNPQQPHMAAQQASISPQQHAALQQKLAQALGELEQLKQQGQPAQPQERTLESLSAEEAMTVLAQDPVGFIRHVVGREADMHLANMKDEAELRGALHQARKAHSEFAQFEMFILQEVAELIQTDDDGVIDPWDKLLDKGVERFREKFKDILKTNPAMLAAAAAEQAGKPMTPHVEGGSSRKMPQLPPAFSRKQIADMSIDDFLKNEAAIEDAMKNGRIR